MLGTLTALKARQHAVVTSVSKFHRQLVVLGRTSSSNYMLSHFECTESIMVSHGINTSRTRGIPKTTTRNHSGTSSNSSRHYSYSDLRQRRSMVLFSLFVLFLISMLVTILTSTTFGLILSMFLLVTLSLYVVALVRLRVERQAKSSTMQFERHRDLNGHHFAPELPVRARSSRVSHMDSGLRTRALSTLISD